MPGPVVRGLALAFVTLGLIGCGGTTLYSDLPEQQANEVEATLLTAGIDAHKKAVSEEGWMITVPRERFPAAVSLLKERGLPRTSEPGLYEVFPKEGFVSSPLEERARYIYALSQELAQTLMQIDGVVTARVHVALPEKAVLEDKQESASVSVVIVQEPGEDLSQYEIDIKAIVTDGIEGLDDVNKVTVRFFNKRKTDLTQYNVELEQKWPAEVLQAGAGGLVIGALICLSVFYFRKLKLKKK